MGVIKWTDESKAIIRRLWVEEGMAASVIAAKLAHTLGRPVTRNAVIGVAHRQGWALGGVERVRRQSANKGNGKTWKRKRRKEAHSPKPLSPLAQLLAEPFVPRTAPVTPLLLDIQELGDDQCRYPCTDGPPYRFCGVEKVGGLPYCDAHARICFVPPNPARSAPRNMPNGIVNGESRLFVADTRTLEVIE
jgi:GcrA cell cycle regulator